LEAFDADDNLFALLGADRTLIRLRNVRLTLERPLERRRMKPHHITLAVEKLKHHHAKLEDLAFKFVVSTSHSIIVLLLSDFLTADRALLFLLSTHLLGVF